MYLFVYGTLRRAAAHPMHALLRPATFVGLGRFQGRLYDLGDCPGAIASADPNDVVRGEVYHLHEPAVALAALDRYEGCTPADAAPHEYVRATTNIHLEAESPAIFSCQIYLYNRPIDKLLQINQGDYLDWLSRRSSIPICDQETQMPPANSTATSD